MREDKVNELLDSIYAAAVEPSSWPATLERFADSIGGSGVWLSRLNVADGTGSGLVTRIDPAMPQIYLDHFASLNPFANARDPDRYLRDYKPDVRLQDHWLPREDLLKTEFYNDFLRPQDIHSTLLVQLTVAGRETVVININRTHAAGGFSHEHITFARRLRPHFARVFALSSRFAGINAREAEIQRRLDSVRGAVFVVAAGGRIDYANAAAEQLADRGFGLRVARGRLDANDAIVARQLDQLIGAATAPAGSPRTGGTLPLGRAGASLTVSPIGAGNSDVFAGGPRAIIVISAPTAAGDPVDHLKTRYGLTPAEARVAVAIAGGASPRAIAETFGLSFHTVRNQLQRLYTKTETRRQSELVLLIARLGNPVATNQ